MVLRIFSEEMIGGFKNIYGHFVKVNFKVLRIFMFIL